MAVTPISLLTFEDSSNLTKDKYNATWSQSGTVTQIQTSYFSPAAYFAAGAYFKLTNNPGLDQNENYTIEFWTDPNAITGDFATILTVTGGFIVRFQKTALDYTIAGSNYVISLNLDVNKLYNLVFSIDQKNHIFKFYLDGELKETRTYSGYWANDWSNVRLCSGTGSSSYPHKVAAFAISKGLKYTSNFTPSKTNLFNSGLYVNFPSTLNGVYDRSPNGLKYCYRVRFVQTDQITETSNVVNYVTEWGRDTNYGNTFEAGCGSHKFEASDATNSVEILSTLAVNAIKKLEDQLNKYIGPFDKPSGRNNLSSNGYVSKGNGTAYFYNIEVLSGGVSPGLTTESTTLQFKATWGTEKNATKLTNVYKNTSIKDETLIDGVKRDAYSTDSEGKVTYTVRPNNYASRESIFKEILDKLENGLKLQLDSYIGNISALDDVKRSITSAGSQYYAKVTRTGTNTEAYATNAKMYLELSYSKGNESYNTIRKDATGENIYKADLAITGANYLEREKLTNELAQNLLNQWEAYVRTLFDKITKAPESKTDNWPTTTGKNIWVQMDFSLGTSSEGEQIINSAFKYSLNNATCDQLYKNGSITINSTNYLTKETEYTNHFNKILAEFKNESSFLNSTPPEEITVNYLALNGITYTCKFKWEYAGTRDWIKSVYRLVTTYGQASDQATTEFRRTTTVEITRENVSYAIRMALFQAEQERELAQLKAYLDTLVANVTIPSPVAREYVATNGQTYAYRVSCSVTPDGDAKSNVTIKSEWGKTTNYGNDFATSTFVLTAVNQTSFDSTVARLMNSHEIKMKGFLDQLIENVAFNGKSGQNLASNGAYYYYKTTVIGLGTTSKTPSEYIKEVGAIE